MERDSKPNYLFFHMGPGFHAKVEAAAFQKKYPHVLFLDQPLELDYSGLVQWAAKTILEVSQQAQAPLTLLGHSFGGCVIRGVLPDVGDKVEEVRLLNSVFNPFECFLNLFENLKMGSLDFTSWEQKPVKEKLELIFAVAQHPRMNEAYWQSSEARKNYLQLAAAHPPLNTESFVKVFTDYLTHPPSVKSWGGPATVLYSLRDNLIRQKACIAPWAEIFPQGQLIDIGDHGHYAHFESVDVAERFFRKKN